jgi:hypothetical protein
LGKQWGISKPPETFIERWESARGTTIAVEIEVERESAATGYGGNDRVPSKAVM